jgi:hypothetical protein
MTNHSKPLSEKQKAYLQNPERTKNHPFRKQNNQLNNYSMKAKYLSKKVKYS